MHFCSLSLSHSLSIADEAGASIYSVSAEAVKEMPDLDPNIRSAGTTAAHTNPACSFTYTCSWQQRAE